jgi:ADP-ribose pyrophosphatase
LSLRFDPGREASLLESTVASEVPFTGHFFEVARDRIAQIDGSLHTREYIRHPGAAAVIPLDAQGRVLIERQYRYAPRAIFTEFPAGKRDPGESTIDTAVRELAEETGHRAAEWAFLTRIYPAIGFANELMDIWICRGLEPVEQRLDGGERLQLHWVEVDALFALCLAHQIPDVKTHIGTLWLVQMHRGLMPWPQFQPAHTWRGYSPA